MKRTLIYVFGPKRLFSQYFSNTELKQQDGGWLKIGQTSETDDSKDKWECAMGRINQETLRASLRCVSFSMCLSIRK